MMDIKWRGLGPTHSCLCLDQLVAHSSCLSLLGGLPVPVGPVDLSTDVLRIAHLGIAHRVTNP